MRSRFQLDQCTAVITGASSGLGAEFARQIDPRAAGLMLASRREDALEGLRLELQKTHPSLRISICPCDIATDEGRARLLSHIERLDARPNLLVNNAGRGDYGSFATSDAGRSRGQIELNITALVLLTHAVLPLMPRTADCPAGILNVSSLAASLPMPDSAVYAATKSFVSSFSEALRVELAAEHVIVSCVCPGPTPTSFGTNARRPDGTDTDRSGQDLIRIPPEQVVSTALDALCRGRAMAHPGFGVAVASLLFRLMPRPLLRWLIARRFERSRGCA